MLYPPAPWKRHVTETEHSGFTRYPLHNLALGLLAVEPKHGYGLYQDFETYFGSIWKAGQTKFYVALTTLQEQGYLDATLEPQENRPPRKVYHLTDKGREAFLAWLHEPIYSMRAMRVEFIAKLRFFDLLGRPGGDELIDRQIAIYESLLAEWEAARSPDDFQDLVRDYRIRQARGIIDWLQAARRKLFGS